MEDLDYVKIISVNPLILVSTDKNKEILIKYTKLWNEIKYLINYLNI